MIIHMIGNAHLDPVWLWPWQASADEALATFRSAADRLDEYPEFIYTRGEAWLFDQIERLDPHLFERARAHIAGGRWQLVGGQWVQPDCNLPTLAGWNKQLEVGARYFREKFGVKPRVGYNVDSFGHPATLPDILSAHGVESYVFHRPGPHQIALPGQTFRWQSASGNQVTGFRIAHSYVTRSDDLYGQIMLALDEADFDLGHTMCFYGVGNHGGGPTKGNIEYILENQKFADGVELKFSYPQAFFDAIAPRTGDLPVVTHELQKTFPGCYCVMADIKRAQHRGEELLAQCGDAIEVFGGAQHQDAQREKLEKAWPDLLFTQFHDILAGTSSSAAWEGVRAMQGRARLAAEELLVMVSRGHAKAQLPPVNQQQIALYNPNDCAWKGYIEHEPFLDFAPWDARWLSDAQGEPIPFQQIEPDASILLVSRVVFPVEIPARSAQIILVRDDQALEATLPSGVAASSERLGNGVLEVELSGQGIAGVRQGGTEVVGAIGLQLRADQSDTWSFVIDRYVEPVEQTLENLRWEVEENGPLRARARAEFKLGDSRGRWSVWLYAGQAQLHWQLEIVWAERYKMLQMPLRLSGVVLRWDDGLAGGSARREPSEVEWPFQSWSRVETDGGAAALVTPDVYSVSVRENLWQFSLLRSPRMAWGGGDPAVYCGRDKHTDQGAHVLQGRFCFGSGEDLSAESLAQSARDLTRPPIVFDRYEGMARPPWGNSPPSSLWTGAEHRARQDGRMMHLQDAGDRDPLAAPVETTDNDP